MSTGRRASITEDSDALVMTTAALAEGRLPAFLSTYVLDALIVSGYVDPDAPHVLTAAGLAEARRWVEIKTRVYQLARHAATDPIPGEPS